MTTLKESLAVFQNSQGLELRGAVVRLTRHSIFFEVYGPSAVFQSSEVLPEFKIIWCDKPVYSGRAVIRSVMNTGMVVICEAALEDAWIDIGLAIGPDSTGRLGDALKSFLQEWEKTYKVLPEYKLIIADMQTFLAEMRLWVDQVELGVRASPSGDRIKLEEGILDELQKPIIPAVNSFFARFEELADKLEPDVAPIHRAYMRRQLHSFVLCAPFAYRTFSKPLGYAGDYEMVNMMLRPPYEGGSMFAKLLNLWFLLQAPAAAHRNRIEYLFNKLNQETARASSEGRRARVFNLACGPAGEVQKFLKESELSNLVDFTLVDFNDETIDYSSNVLADLKERHGRGTNLHWIKKSVHQLLKESSKSVSAGPQTQYDFVYCAGLFDYLSDQVCQRLMTLMYSWVAPGGLLVATNVDPSNPMRNGMEHLLDWHLIYRTSRQAEILKPLGAAPENFGIKSDLTGVNLFIETRKPRNG